jgi:SprB repeat/Secretion system C-terminal sorting domain
MKRALLFLAAFIGTAITSMAQVTSISVETFYTDNGSVAGYPAGHTTYRVYANTTNSTDRVVVVTGNDVNPLILNVSGSGIWNHNPGGVLGDDANCTIYSIQPLAEYDSYLTIGYSCNNDGSLFDVYAAEDLNSTWQNELFGTVPYGIGNATVNTPVGGTWFVIPTNAVSAGGVSNKVLLAQITTDGDICGVFNLQVFPNYTSPGDPYIVQNGLEFGSSVTCGTPGCTDPTALNYNSEAGYDNGLCLYDCELTADIVAQGPSCAGDDNGSIEVTGSGNQSYIHYTFEGNDEGLSDDGIELFNGLSNGSYTVTLRDTRFDNELANPGGLTCEVTEVVELNTTELFLTSSVPVALTCGGDTDGCVSTIPANYGGGTGALSFMIINNATGNPIQNGTGGDLTLPDPNYCGLGAGAYHFEVMDANGCTASGDNFNILSPGTLTLFAGAQTPASCFNTSDGVQVITWGGGTGDVDFSLVDDGIYEIEGNVVNAILNNLPGGTAMLYAQDENGCTAELSFEMAAGPQITINPAVTEPLCFGNDNGSINVMAGGGTGALQFSFDGVNYSAVAESAGLIAGDYMVYVKDANDCVASDMVTVGQPDELAATVDANNISCNGLADGSIIVTATGGTLPYAYSTIDGDFTPSPTLGGLSADSYDVYVVDGNGCAFMLADAASITEPAALASSAAASAACADVCDGSVVMTTSGGTGAYSYSVDGGASSSNNVIEDLCPETYEITVSDANGCEVVVSNVTISESSAIVITGLEPDPINQDPGGNTVYTVAGGTEPYSYEWTGPNNFTSTEQNLPDLTSDTQDGDYVLTITDANGCTTTQTINVTGISELGNEYSISLYPNPNNGDFIINILGMKGEKMSYAVLDASGRIVFGKELGNVNGTRTESINMMDAAAGIYNVQFMIGSEMHSLRFVKN